ncbi:MAG TPA: SRPBCC domain-containing protein [Polyangiaceae bacterium]|nr:SRPBCC domain-containing protein [Polyangiaceae bacterium]
MNKPNVIHLEHVYAHAPSAVWKMLTDPALHARWWAAGDVKPVVGHRFELDMGTWGKQPCEVIEVQPERLFKYRFATTSLDTTISWTLVPEGSGTRLTLTHEGFDLDSPMGRQALEGMGKGWPGLLSRMEKVLDG